jgi:tetratricopeptide (TPR) repeat protein
LFSQAHQAPVGDLFQLQDALTRRIVDSLAVPLSARDRANLGHDVPSNAQAYEFYLRANQVAYQASNWGLARDLYLKCLDLDPDYAPAWARLGRVYRVISVFTGRDVEKNYASARQAFTRAFELSPDLSVAHHLSTALDVEVGRAREAMLRLLDRVRLRMNDAELFAGLVQATRYCGLLDASAAAYERAHRLDPAVRTSVNHAYLMRGEYQRALETSLEDPPYVYTLVLELMGRTDEAVELCRKQEEHPASPLFQHLFGATRTLLQGDLEAGRRLAGRLLNGFYDRDPCVRYYLSRHLARLGETEKALTFLRQTVEGGFTCYTFMVRDPWLDGLRGNAAFKETLHLAERGQRESMLAFLAAGGDRLLGLERV